jgi:transcriptional regulator with XRE-family HTH domain
MARTLTPVEKLRRERGWTQKRLAELTCINQSYLSLLERGQLVPTPGQWDVLARVFGVSVATLRAAVVINEREGALV